MSLNMLLNIRNISSLTNVSQFYIKSVFRAFSESSRPKEQTVKIQNWNINYIKVGTGDHHVLFVPGAFGTKWSHGGPIIERLNREKFTLVALDPPGYGKSRPPEKEFTLDFFERDADMAHEFMTVLGIPQYSLLGFSAGGVSAYIQAAKYSEAVKKLVAWSTFTFMSPLDIDIQKNFLTSPTCNYAFPEYLDKNAWSDKQLKPLSNTYGEDFIDKYWSKWASVMKEIYQRDNGNICTECLERIKCPTLLLYGSKDPLMNVKVHIPYAAKRIKDSRVYVYREGRHHIQMNYAEDFNRRVEEFLLSP